MFISFFFFWFPLFIFIFFIFDGLTICHPSPTTRYLSPATPHPLPVTRYPSPATRHPHPPPVTHHPSPATRHPRKSPAGAAQLRSVTEIAPKSPFLMCEQKPYLVWFSCQHKSYQVSGYEHLSDMWLSSLEIGAAQLRFLTEIAPKSPFLCVNRSPIWYGFRASTKAIRYQGMNTYPICDSRL